MLREGLFPRNPENFGLLRCGDAFGMAAGWASAPSLSYHLKYRDFNRVPSTSNPPHTFAAQCCCRDLRPLGRASAPRFCNVSACESASGG
jgi:hypothetical protein